MLLDVDDASNFKTHLPVCSLEATAEHGSNSKIPAPAPNGVSLLPSKAL